MLRLKKWTAIAPYVGMIFLQCASLPSLYSVLIGQADLPPATMIWMVWLGLALYMVHAIADKIRPYILSNGIGLVLNGLLLVAIYTH